MQPHSDGDLQAPSYNKKAKRDRKHSKSIAAPLPACHHDPTLNTRACVCCCAAQQPQAIMRTTFASAAHVLAEAAPASPGKRSRDLETADAVPQPGKARNCQPSCHRERRHAVLLLLQQQRVQVNALEIWVSEVWRLFGFETINASNCSPSTSKISVYHLIGNWERACHTLRSLRRRSGNAMTQANTEVPQKTEWHNPCCVPRCGATFRARARFGLRRRERRKQVTQSPQGHRKL